MPLTPAIAQAASFTSIFAFLVSSPGEGNLGLMMRAWFSNLSSLKEVMQGRSAPPRPQPGLGSTEYPKPRLSIQRGGWEWVMAEPLHGQSSGYP